MHGLLEQVWHFCGLPSCKTGEADSLLDSMTSLDVSIPLSAVRNKLFRRKALQYDAPEG